MSVRSLTSTAVKPKTDLVTFTDVLISAIPTEPLAAYTAMIGVISAVPKVGLTGYKDLRWLVYGIFLAVVFTSVLVSYWVKHTPGTGDSSVTGPLGAVKTVLPALVAGAAWGLAMPGSALGASLSGDHLTIATSAVAIGGAVLLSAVVQPLTNDPNKLKRAAIKRDCPPEVAQVPATAEATITHAHEHSHEVVVKPAIVAGD